MDTDKLIFFIAVLIIVPTAMFVAAHYLARFKIINKISRLIFLVFLVCFLGKSIINGLSQLSKHKDEIVSIKTFLAYCPDLAFLIVLPVLVVLILVGLTYIIRNRIDKLKKVNDDI